MLLMDYTEHIKRYSRPQAAGRGISGMDTSVIAAVLLGLVSGAALLKQRRESGK